MRRRNRERDAEIARRRVHGETANDLAAAYGITASTIYHILAREGVKGERGAARKFRYCENPACGKVIWNGRNAHFCSDECRWAVRRDRRQTCAATGCDVKLIRKDAKFCSLACYHQSERDFFAAALPKCAHNSCQNPVRRPNRKYCSQECASRARIKFSGFPCARPGCACFTDRPKKKYCSVECRDMVLKVPGGASDRRRERDARRVGRVCEGEGCTVSMDHEYLGKKRCDACRDKRLRARQRAYDAKRRAKRRGPPSPEGSIA